MLGFYILEDEGIKFLPWFLSACFVIINVGVWTGLGWLRIETGGGLL
jgi:hypothetical protein